MDNLVEIILATNNENKRIEILDIFKDNNLNRLNVLIPEEVLGVKIDTKETGDTLEQNAYLKAKNLFELTKKTVISDDTGLEIEYLSNFPGVHSARFAGENASDEENRKKVLDLMRGVPENMRKAKFRTIICLIHNGIEHYFEGICTGKILEKEKGLHGFGYDPIFLPDGHTKSFAEMHPKEKNTISHRAIAIKKLAEYLKNYFLIGNST